MSNDKKNKLLGSLRLSKGKRITNVVSKSTRATEAEANAASSTKVLARGSSLTELLDSRNKATTRKSTSFEEDDGFVFKRTSSLDVNDESSKGTSVVPKDKVSSVIPRVGRRRPETKTKVGTQTTSKTTTKPDPVIPTAAEISKTTKKRGRPPKLKNKSVLSQIETPSEEENEESVPKKARRRNENPVKTQNQSQSFKFNKTTSKKGQPLVSPPVSSPANKKKGSNNNKIDFTEEDHQDTSYEEYETSIQMTLPLSDSPVQKRNMQMRERDRESGGSKRRSSLSNRGKRVSSIGNGFVAVPHLDVPLQDFYKHLDENLPEPHKMRRLLIWCSKRLLTLENAKLRQQVQKSSSDELTAFNIAKVIKEEIIRDLVDGRLNTSWYSREDEAAEVEESANRHTKETVKLLPNPQNLSNLENIKVYEKKLAELRREKLKWEVLVKNKSSLFSESMGEDIKASDHISADTSSVISNELSDLTVKFSKFEQSLVTNKSLEYQIDQFHKFVSNLSTNDEVLSKVGSDLKNKVNHLMSNYTSVKDRRLRSQDSLLRGIAKLEGEEAEEAERAEEVGQGEAALQDEAIDSESAKSAEANIANVEINT